MSTTAAANEQSEGLGLRLVQGGAPLSIDIHRTNRLLVPPQYVGMSASPFSIELPPSKCTGPDRAVFVRVMPVEAMEDLVEQVYAMNFGALTVNALDTLFPQASGYAAYPEVAQTQLWTSPTAADGDGWAHNYFIEDRFASRAASGDRIDVFEVLDLGAEADWLAEGRPFLMMIGRRICDTRPHRLGIDLIAVRFGATGS